MKRLKIIISWNNNETACNFNLCIKFISGGENDKIFKIKSVQILPMNKEILLQEKNNTKEQENGQDKERIGGIFSRTKQIMEIMVNLLLLLSVSVFCLHTFLAG